jgi:hypothetical protein
VPDKETLTVMPNRRLKEEVTESLKLQKISSTLGVCFGNEKCLRRQKYFLQSFYTSTLTYRGRNTGVEQRRS